MARFFSAWYVGCWTAWKKINNWWDSNPPPSACHAESLPDGAVMIEVYSGKSSQPQPKVAIIKF